VAYLDHAATTPVRPEALAALTSAYEQTGNASSLHGAGRHARKLVEEARESVAASLGCRPGEVVFTSGGTESDNLAIKGIFWSRQADDAGRTRVLCSAVEHHAVLDPVLWLGEHEKAHVDLIGVDSVGRVELAALAELIERDPASIALISVMAANNEVGTIEPVAKIVDLAREAAIPVHSDAVQAVGSIPIDFALLGLDALTVSSHKVGGPHGVGALVARRGRTLEPVLHGGSQERSRSGTLDAPGIAGFAAALAAAVECREDSAVRIGALRDNLVRGVLLAVPDAVLTGDRDPAGRLPGHAHFSFPGCEGDALLMLLDAQSVECSTGSACTAGIPEPSHVLLAMGVDPELARGSLRFSLGWTSTQSDVDELLDALPAVVDRARRAGRPRIRPMSRSLGGSE